MPGLDPALRAAAASPMAAWSTAQMLRVSSGVSTSDIGRVIILLAICSVSGSGPDLQHCWK
jgi:hypothetical protein